MVDHRTPPKLAAAALAVAADIRDRAQYQTMVERLLGEWGRWDVLVNNAAVVPGFAA